MRVSEGSREPEGQRECQEQGPGWGQHSLPAVMLSDPAFVGRDLHVDGRGLTLLASWAAAHHSHQVPCALYRTGQGLAAYLLLGGMREQKRSGRPEVA